MARWKRQRRRLSQALGIKLPEIGDERDAPPVEEEELRAFVEKRLSAEAQRRIDDLIWRFHSWAVAYCKILKWREGIDPTRIR